MLLKFQGLEAGSCLCQRNSTSDTARLRGAKENLVNTRLGEFVPCDRQKQRGEKKEKRSQKRVVDSCGAIDANNGAAQRLLLAV